MNMNVGDTVIITTDRWFIAPDGQQYRAIFGTIKGIKSADDTLGITPNAQSTNWYVEIGNMIVAGCQIHYVVKTKQYNKGDVHGRELKDGKVSKYEHPCSIYNADLDDTDD